MLLLFGEVSYADMAAVETYFITMQLDSKSFLQGYGSLYILILHSNAAICVSISEIHIIFI